MNNNGSNTTYKNLDYVFSVHHKQGDILFRSTTFVRKYRFFTIILIEIY